MWSLDSNGPEFFFLQWKTATTKTSAKCRYCYKKTRRLDGGQKLLVGKKIEWCTLIPTYEKKGSLSIWINFSFTHLSSKKVKFRHYEKATKFEKISHLIWQNSCFYSVASKQAGDFFQIFVAFSEKLDFITIRASRIGVARVAIKTTNIWQIH